MRVCGIVRQLLGVLTTRTLSTLAVLRDVGGRILVRVLRLRWNLLLLLMLVNNARGSRLLRQVVRRRRTLLCVVGVMLHQEQSVMGF